ncbi:MAG: LysR family transcriptional regulator [Salinicola sp.]|uniref:winged helix-turn-helix domain-containing protein n=1 Tax=Salinicola sp. TaxID=1978524 RepID=UPI000C8DDD27|nr:LysR family transcriptional regulator [Salinicola sp.]MAM58867.1 LysR family transcriptional regulator [Salinicola sp.]NRB57787.1 LysR family transcriptional regulator [Salinicola sp.]
MTRTHHPSPRFQLRLVADREIVVGPGKIELLEAIERHGSIAAACREMGLSYKKAWQLLDTMNRHLAAPVVDTVIGGTRRGGATLTAQGRALVDDYRRLMADLDDNPHGQALMNRLAPPRAIDAEDSQADAPAADADSD